MLPPTIAVESQLITLNDEGFSELNVILSGFQKEQDKAAAEIIKKITQEMLRETQKRSPYLYGILRGAHLMQMEKQGGSERGIIGIHPATTHPILGGRPSVYGLRIHNEDGRPWFLWTIQDHAERILQEYGSSLGEMYTNIAQARYIGPKALWNKWW